MQYYLPLIGESPEHDWSDKTNEGTVTGALVGENPPIGALYGYPADGPLEVAEVGGANPKGPLGHPLYGPFAGPVAA